MDWLRAYADHQTPWDLRQVTPPLEALLGSGRLAELGIAPGSRVAVPGCGRGHDLRAWARAGYRVTGFDIVPAAVAEARQLLAWNTRPDEELEVEVLCRDVLGLGLEFAGRFDLVYDYTCFCALPVHLRPAYGREVAAIVRPGGLWLGLAFPLDPARVGSEGPPHLVRPDDLETALGAGFARLGEFPAERSVLRRQGAEHWFVRRRS
jgi:SAM-dependent methyltransferase